MKSLQISLIFAPGIITGVISIKLIDRLIPTEQIVLHTRLESDEKTVLPKGTVLNYVDNLPEGYLVAYLSVAIECEAVKHIDYKTEPQSNLRNQHFFYKANKATYYLNKSNGSVSFKS